MRLRVALAALLVLCAYLWWSAHAVSQPPGVLAHDAPEQTVLEDREVFQHDGFAIEKVARFDVTARVLAKERYWFGKESALAPYDLALGWGRMSDTSVLDHISIGQSNRYYYWMVRDFPIPRSEIISNSANMHLIPATDAVRDALGKVRRGQVVRFTGYLVGVRGPNGWRWNTSTTRTDTGAGACELVWVESFGEVSNL